MTWQQTFGLGHEIVLATCSKQRKPRAIVAISLGFLNGKLLIGACQMRKTLENIAINNEVSIVGRQKNQYFRVQGKATLMSSGRYFTTGFSRSKPPMPKQVIVISPKEVYDLDKGKRVL